MFPVFVKHVPFQIQIDIFKTKHEIEPISQATCKVQEQSSLIKKHLPHSSSGLTVESNELVAMIETQQECDDEDSKCQNRATLEPDQHRKNTDQQYPQIYTVLF